MEIITTVCLLSKHSTASHCAQYWGDNGNKQKAQKANILTEYAVDY